MALALSTASAAVAAPAAPRRAPATKELALRFACPGDARATRTLDEERAIGATGTRVKGAAVLRFARSGDACEVSFEPEPSQSGAAEGGAPLALVAGPDGAFLGFQRTEALAAAPAIAPPAGAGDDAGDDREASPGGGEQAEQASRAFLAREEEAWSDVVARWAGKRAVLGRTYEERLAAEGDDERAAPLRLRWAVRRRLPCPGERRRRCVELWARATPDEDILRRACARGASSLDTSGLRHVVWELFVVTDPETLLPRRARREWTSRPACPGGDLPGPEVVRWKRTWSWSR